MQGVIHRVCDACWDKHYGHGAAPKRHPMELHAQKCCHCGCPTFGGIAVALPRHLSTCNHIAWDGAVSPVVRAA